MTERVAARARYVGVDLARFVAVTGMMAAHLIALNTMLPGVDDAQFRVAETAELITNGTAAPLFAVLGGVSSAFATRRMLRGGRAGAAIAAVALRGVLLVLLGLLLGYIENSLVVVLAYYGAAMILLAPLIAAPRGVLAATAAVLGLTTGVLNALARRALDLSIEGPHLSFEDLAADPIATLRALLLTGQYPAVTWCCYLIAGVLIGRALMSSAARGAVARTAAGLAAGGVAAFAFAHLASNLALDSLEALGVRELGDGVYTGHDRLVELIMDQGYGAPASPDLWVQLIAAPHSGSVMDLLRTIGISCAVIGLLVLLFDRGSGDSVVRPRSIPGRIVDAVRCTGAAPLTVYTLHIAVSGMLLGPYLTGKAPIEGSIPWWAMGPGAFALQLGGALLLGAILSATGRRGPLEALMARIVGLVSRR